MDAGEVRSASDSILRRLVETPAWREAELVLTYLSMPNEVSTDSLVREALRNERGVGVPRLCDGEMLFFPLAGLEEATEVNDFGIREPCSGLEPLGPRHLEAKRVLLIVPGLAFDRNRNRLGRGGGYYDRFIRSLRRLGCPTLTIAGVFFHRQLWRDVPTDPWDQALDVVLTENTLFA